MTYNDQRTEQETGTSVVTDETPSRVSACPGCGGNIITDEDRKRVCSDCGLIIDEDKIDRGPEWRAFSNQEYEEKSRVGAPLTKTMHDMGLSTKISRQNRDARGNTLSARQQKKMRRLRSWNRRSQTENSTQKNLKRALAEINRMASVLGLSHHVRETAGILYRRALEENLLPGRSIEGIATATLYAAARMAGVPRNLDEMVHVSRVDQNEVARGYLYINRQLDLEIGPTDPEKYLSRFISELGLREDVRRCARDLLQHAKKQGVHSGKSPTGLAAAAIYAGSVVTEGKKVTQNEVSTVANVSEVTIRNRYQELIECAEARSDR